MTELRAVFPDAKGTKKKNQKKRRPQLSLITILLGTNSGLNSTNNLGSSQFITKSTTRNILQKMTTCFRQ